MPAVAKILDVSRSTAYRLVHSGELPALRIGQSLRVDADELEHYMYGEPHPHGGVDPAGQISPSGPAGQAVSLRGPDVGRDTR